MARNRPHAVLKPGTPLWSVFEFLRDRGAKGATSLELAEAFEGRNLNISTTAADIRKVCGQRGYTMLPARYEGRTGKGPSARKVYRYQLVKTGQAPEEQPKRVTMTTPAPGPRASSTLFPVDRRPL